MFEISVIPPLERVRLPFAFRREQGDYLVPDKAYDEHEHRHYDHGGYKDHDAVHVSALLSGIPGLTGGVRAPVLRRLLLVLLLGAILLILLRTCLLVLLLRIIPGILLLRRILPGHLTRLGMRRLRRPLRLLRLRTRLLRLSLRLPPGVLTAVTDGAGRGVDSLVDACIHGVFDQLYDDETDYRNPEQGEYP